MKAGEIWINMETGRPVEIASVDLDNVWCIEWGVPRGGEGHVRVREPGRVGTERVVLASILARQVENVAPRLDRVAQVRRAIAQDPDRFVAERLPETARKLAEELRLLRGDA